MTWSWPTISDAVALAYRPSQEDQVEIRSYDALKRLLVTSIPVKSCVFVYLLASLQSQRRLGKHVFLPPRRERHGIVLELFWNSHGYVTDMSQLSPGCGVFIRHRNFDISGNILHGHPVSRVFDRRAEL